MRKASILTRSNKIIIAYTASALLLVVSIGMGISFGSLGIPIPSILRIFVHEVFGIQAGTIDAIDRNIMMNIRLPRVILAALVGAALALSGAAFQGLLKNPLADPYTLGVSQGASVGAVATLFFSLQFPLLGSFTLPFLSMTTALVTLCLVLFFARLVHRGMSISSLILTGVIFSSF